MIWKSKDFFTLESPAPAGAVSDRPTDRPRPAATDRIAEGKKAAGTASNYPSQKDPCYKRATDAN